LDFSRLRNGEMIAGIGGLALLVFLFFDWFGGGGVEVSGNVATGTATIKEAGLSGWDSLTDLAGFLIILSGVSGIALAGLAAAGQRVNLGGLPRGGFTALLGSLAVALVLWEMVAGSRDLKIGVFLGLAAVAAVAIGALMALREDGYEPLVSVGGGRTRSSSASAPAATPTARPASASRSSSRSGGGSTTRKSSTTRRSSTGRSSTGRSSTSRSSSGGSKRSGSKRSGSSRSGSASKSRSSSSSRSGGSATKRRSPSRKK
jgi:hypothetical protein